MKTLYGYDRLFKEFGVGEKYAKGETVWATKARSIKRRAVTVSVVGATGPFRVRKKRRVKPSVQSVWWKRDSRPKSAGGKTSTTS